MTSIRRVRGAGRGAVEAGFSRPGTARLGTRGSGLGNLVLATCFLLMVSGCRQDMHNQPKYRPLRPSPLFADGSSARPAIDGTVARGALQEDEAFFTGKVAGAVVRELPFKIEAADLDRGEERFNIFCTPCHDKTGNGKGMVVQRGYRQPPSFHIERLRQAEPGYMFDVITNGFGVMPDYKAQVDPRDRWRIIAYVRALQLSQAGTAADIPGGDPEAANKQRQPAGGGKH